MNDDKRWRGEQVMAGIIPAPNVFKDKQRRYVAAGYAEKDAEAWAIHDTVRFFLEQQAFLSRPLTPVSQGGRDID